MMEKENFKINSEELIDREEIEIVEKVKAIIKFLYSLKGKRGEINDKIFKIINELEKNHSKIDLEKTYLFHIMSSSSIDREECTKFDLEGEDSMVKHLEALVKEYQTKAE